MDPLDHAAQLIFGMFVLVLAFTVTGALACGLLDLYRWGGPVGIALLALFLTVSYYVGGHLR